MNKIRIVADDKIPFLRESPLAELTDLRLLPGGAITRNDLMNADALITRTRTACNAELLNGTAVRLIATATIGFDHIDRSYCESHGIVWTNAPGCNADSVAQYITSLLLVHAEKCGEQLAGKTVGIVGVGNVGSRVAKVADILGMRVLLNDPPRKDSGENGFVSLKQICEEADFITFHVPLQREGKYRTFHLAGMEFFHSLKRKPFLINSSRGEVVCGEALKAAIRNAEVCGAALDVWEHEPRIDAGLMELVEFATPHIAGYSTDGKANGTAASVAAVAEFFGLEEIRGWYPRVPEPEHSLLNVKSVTEAVTMSYDIRRDDRRLRESPETFEKQRGSYPLRREFPAFAIAESSELSSPEHSVLKRLGFRG